MVRRTSRRSSSRRARARARTLLRGAGVLLVAGVFVAAAFLAGDDPQPVPAVPSARNDGAVAGSHAPAAPSVARPVYRYSVVPGGVYSASDVRTAIASDAVVGAHYAQVSVEDLRAERGAVERHVYMSYRKGDRLYWTRERVRLPAGEVVLTDGRAEIRARCGNCISETPMQPTSPDEPPDSAFDEVEPAQPDSRHEGMPAAPGAHAPAAPFPLMPGDSLALATMWDPVGPAGGPVPTPGIPLGGGSPPDAIRSTAIPRASIPSIAVPGSPTHPVGTPVPPFEQPIPVPEPGSLLLLASGLGAYGLRRLRRRR